jgi:hypothetical protein
MDEFRLFIAGLLLCNSIPHVVSGLCGMPFPTPFSERPTIARSSPVVNFLWGTGNLFAATLILLKRLVLEEYSSGLLAFAVGFVVAGVFLSLHFENAQKNGRDT